MLVRMDSHPDWSVGEIVTARGAAGIVDGIWMDEAGAIHLTLSGADHSPENGAIPVPEVTRGGTLSLHAPTLEAAVLHPKVYRIVHLSESERAVPPGWAVLHLHDNAYVAWGLPSRRRAEDIALGHQIGTGHFASRM